MIIPSKDPSRAALAAAAATTALLLSAGAGLPPPARAFSPISSSESSTVCQRHRDGVFACGSRARTAFVAGGGGRVISFTTTSSELRMSDVGGGLGDRGGGGSAGGGGRRGGGGGKGDGFFDDDFFDPEGDPNKGRGKDRRKGKISDSRLPISYRSDYDGTREPEFDLDEDGDDDADAIDDEEETRKLLEAAGIDEPGPLELQAAAAARKEIQLLQNNPYVRVVNSLSPSELIGRFTATAHPRVQSAVKATILGLIGNLPKMAFETTTVTSGERLASLMFQLQMTGYMFKNAEYRMSLTNTLGGVTPRDRFNNGKLLGGESSVAVDDDDDDEEDGASGDVFAPDAKVSGKIKVRYGGGGGGDASADVAGGDDPGSVAADDDDDGGPPEEAASVASASVSENGDPLDPLSAGYEVEVDSAAYVSELREEVRRLRDELDSRRRDREETIRRDLLAYIRTLPAEQMRELTGTVSPEVLAAMKGLVNVVMAGMGGDGEGEDDQRPVVVAPDTITEQSGEAMAQLCMWQLVVGYNLRELEVREEMKEFMSMGPEADVDDGGIILD